MKAYIKSLEGKYYGTVIHAEVEDGVFTEFEIWYSGGEPSERELASHGYTVAQWRENVLVDNGWDGQTRIRDLDLTCDSHHETQPTYDLARKIVDALNGGEA